MSKAIWGGKITTSHSTLTETAAKVVDVANKLNEVTKISIGVIKHVGGGEKRLKFLPIVGGVKAAVRGDGSVQELFIYTGNPTQTQQKLFDEFNRR